MKLNYHYHTVKTLAVAAGFDEHDAQYIAYYSQQVDDFILHSPFLVGERPPDFFVKNGLALKVKDNRWAFFPCCTGINALRTISSGYRQTTLLPFHFIPPKPYHDLPKQVERSAYRCVSANRGADLLINRILFDLDKRDLLALGMFLHTYADTFAHEFYSGLQGWENASFVETGMHRGESLLFRALPSIGHANAGFVPDVCDLKIAIYGKRTEESDFEPLIVRDNNMFFADCSRRILDILCAANKKPPIGNRDWQSLQAKLHQAQAGERHHIDEHWVQVFPNIPYGYKKDEFMKIEFELLHHDENLLNRLRLKPTDLKDPYHPESDWGRVSAFVLAHTISDDFYRFNEAAFRHVHRVTGLYATQSHLTQLNSYCRLAEGAV